MADQQNGPVYVVASPESQGLVLRWLPDKLVLLTEELVRHLTQEFGGEIIDDDLLFSVNWEVRQWVIRKLDEVD